MMMTTVNAIFQNQSYDHGSFADYWLQHCSYEWDTNYKYIYSIHFNILFADAILENESLDECDSVN